MGIPHVRKIDIHIETSGYAKFRDMPSRASVDAYRPTTGLSFTQQVARESGTELGRERATSLRPHPSPMHDHHLANDGFTRQVVMSYGQSWKTNFKKAFHIRDRPSTPQKAGSISPVDLALPRPHHARQGSASTIGSVESDAGGLSPTVITQPGPGLKPKGYVFLSPWDGRCEFRTSTNGRSLKCRHVLGPANAKIDARDLAHNLRDAQAMGRSRGDELSAAMVGAKPVSELRFNIPGTGRGRGSGSGSSTAGGNGNGNAEGGREGRLAEQFGRLLHRESHSSDEEEDDGLGYDEDIPMDLSLGREHAGGGNNGKRAKLGKLIIHDEGLKMLDLVVAANIGVWWVTWGRTF
jgi:NADH dehydrogenase (ubiquinone) Fe-S protein 8